VSRTPDYVGNLIDASEAAAIVVITAISSLSEQIRRYWLNLAELGETLNVL
jgi:hypothetical protein